MTQVQPLAGNGAPLSVRAVERAAALLAGRGESRRRFLGRVAVVGSALALNPLRFILRPTPAYASVCGSGNSCGAGWSVFCCTVNDGANTCPDGSFVAGWWKVDDSAFCLGAPRYYIDCNRRPKATCSCRCNTTGCDQRRVCCNVFRYGQCNTHIGGVTEVVCRIITCTPPWQWDPSCGRTVRTSPATRSHSSRCLPGPNPSHIEIKYQDLGLAGSKLGRPVARERDAARGGRRRSYDNGLIVYRRSTGAHEVRGAIARRYRELDAEAGPLGYPRTDHTTLDDDRGSTVRFEGGSIYTSGGTGTHEVLGRSDRSYRGQDGPTGRLGYPTAGTRGIKGPGKVTRFENGAIFMSADTDAVAVTGRMLEVFEERGGPVDSGLGLPVEPAQQAVDGARLQRFERGVITAAPGGRLFAVRGPIYDRYAAEGGPAGPLGYAASHTEAVEGTDGERSEFVTATVFWSPRTGAFALSGPILDRYLREGGPRGTLGFPTSDVVTAPDGRQQATFERGAVTYDPATGQTQVTPNR